MTRAETSVHLHPPLQIGAWEQPPGTLHSYRTGHSYYKNRGRTAGEKEKKIGGRRHKATTARREGERERGEGKKGKELGSREREKAEKRRGSSRGKLFEDRGLVLPVCELPPRTFRGEVGFQSYLLPNSFPEIYCSA